MMLGLIAVFAAIVYKVGESGRAAEAAAAGLAAQEPVEGRITIPAGHRVVSTALDGDRALLRLEAPGGASVLLLVDLATGAELARHQLVAE